MHYYTFHIHNGSVHYILVCRLFHSLNDLLVCVFYFYYSLQQYNVYYSINRPTDLPSVHLFGRPSGHSSVCPFVVSSCVRSFVRSFFVISSCVRSFIGSFFVVRQFVCSSVRSFFCSSLTIFIFCFISFQVYKKIQTLTMTIVRYIMSCRVAYSHNIFIPSPWS